jgi:hypothetical protein
MTDIKCHKRVRHKQHRALSRYTSCNRVSYLTPCLLFGITANPPHNKWDKIQNKLNPPLIFFIYLTTLALIQITQGRITGRWRTINWKDVDGSGRSLAYYTLVHRQLFGVTQVNHKHYGGDSRCPDRDSNRVRPECESKPTYLVATKNVI